MGKDGVGDDVIVTRDGDRDECPPLLKKSRTISVETCHFPGPLFPAVRRPPPISPFPPPPPLSPNPNHSSSSSSSSSSKTNTNTNTNTNTGGGGQFLNTNNNSRDYIYPSCLPPYASSNSNSNSTPKPLNPQQRLRLQPSPIPIPNPDSLPTSTPSSFFHYSLIFTCFFTGFYALYLRIKLTQLQEHNSPLNQPPPVHSFFFIPHGRSLALFTLLSTLILPFLFYNYLHYLPQIHNFSHNTNDNVPFNKRIAYLVDVCFSIYPYAKLLALLFSTIFLILFGGLALYAVSDANLPEALWLSWTFVADSGNHADRVGIGPRIVSVSITAGGMLIFAMMLGLVSDAITDKVDSLRKGKSEVIERNHILILGWSDKLGSLLKQLAIANKSIGGGVVVVLAERDKEEMEMDIAKLEFDFMGTSVICRSGSPLILADLKKVSVSKARAIIVLASDENADQSDARALRVVLSLTGVKERLRGHVVVEMSDLDNEPLVKLVGGELIETVVAHDVIGRLMIQCALQPGLAQIWEDILGFENSEFYIKRWPQLDGLRFGDVLISFPDAIPCGIKVAADGGKIILNPDDNYILKEKDEVLVIAEDDDTYAPGPTPEVRGGFFQKIIDPPKYPEKILFCGWRRDIDDMIMVLEAILAPGSELWMFNEVPEREREKKLIDGGLDISRLVNIKLVHREGNAVIRRHLESLPLETYDSILILADESLEDSVVHSDSRSLATLLLIRDIQSKRLPNKDTKSSSTSLRLAGFSHNSWIREMQQASDKSIIISEILDSRTRNLVSVSRISDYVLSNELVSMALAMVAEDKQINRVLEELFAEEGNEMCIRPAEFYLVDQEELSFYDIMIRGRQRREIVIGYRLATAEQAIINPLEKSEKTKSTFHYWKMEDSLSSSASFVLWEQEEASASVSAYQILFASVPLSHLVLSLVLILLIILYNLFEFHFLHDLFHAFRGDPVSLTYSSDSHLYQSVVSKCTLLHSTYLSTPWLSSPHLQTIFLSLFHTTTPLPYQRHLFRVPDGGTIALDWLRTSQVQRSTPAPPPPPHDDAKTPIVILIPGLTSDSTAPYIKHFAFVMAQRGWNVVVSNHRGLGGISLTSDCAYNAGWTEDIRRVVQHIHSQHSEAPLFVVGTSLGANVLVKYLGEDGADLPISGAAAISSPWDLLICDRFINRRLVQKFYNKALASGLQDFALLHQSRLSRVTEWEGIKKSRSVRDFDNYATRVLGNFETVDAYYRHSSSTSFVGNVAVPLLCINALDDPVCTKEGIPWDECRANRNIVLATTLHGGHIAFYEGITANSLWWVRAVDEFFSVLQSSRYIDVVKQTQKATTPTSLSSTINQGPYVSVLEDGMVAAIGDKQTDDAVEDMPNQQIVNVSINDVIVSDKEEADNFVGRTLTKNDQSENDAYVANPARKCIDCVSRQSRKTIWLLAYIALVTSWPMVRPVLSLLFKKRLKNVVLGGSHKR